ncbi:hypothetical protein WJX74_002035 [Apatococcus lobatus]|uniref:Bromo domain-containing protein n=1 Tax=Apatococcus lobatus TaxID=904363 RepID=A0AAW1RA03_9CHLO
MNGPPRSQGLKVVLKLPKSQAPNKPGQTPRPPNNSSQAQAAQPLKKRKRPEEPVSTPNGWSQPSSSSPAHLLSRASEGLSQAASRPQHPPGSKKSKLAFSGPQINPVDPFASQAHPTVKPRFTVKVAGQAPTPRPDWSSPQPEQGAGPSTVKLGSVPPSKQQKGLKSKKPKASELSSSDPFLPAANGLAEPPGQHAHPRPKLKVKQAQATRPPVPAPSETNISEPSASGLTEDDASFQQHRPMGAPPLSNTAAAEQRPDIPVTRQDLLRVVDRVQQKDWYEIFRDPVTDAVAPGYSQKISRPMDFTKIRAQLEAGFYRSWDTLMEDMETMFNNAMIYNTDDTVFHQQAKSLLDITRQTIGYARKGIKDMRGRTAGSVRKHNAQFVANEKADRDARRLAARATKQAARNAKMAELAAASGLALPSDLAQARPDALGGAERDGFGERAATTRARDAEARRQQLLDENVRMTYCAKSKDPASMRWHSLAGGANGEGAAFAKGLAVRSCIHSVAPPRDAYSRSIAHFAEGLSGKARDLALARAAHFMAANAARSTAAPVQRPAATPSAHSSLRQVTPPMGSHANPHAFRTTPPIVMSAPHNSSTPAAGHGNRTMGRVPGIPAASAASPAAPHRATHQQLAQQLPVAHGTASPMGSLGAPSRDCVTAFGSPFTPMQQTVQPNHRALGSHGPTAHSQYSHYRPPLSGLTVTSHGAGTNLPSIAPSSMHPTACTPAGSSSRPVAFPSGHASDPLKYSGATSHPGHDRPAGIATHQEGSRGLQGLPLGTSSHVSSPRPPSHSLPGQQQQPQQQPSFHHLQQQRGPSPLGTMSHGTAAVQQQTQRAPTPLGQSSLYGDKASSIAPAEYHASSWRAQHQDIGPGGHRQHDSRPGQNHPRLPASSAVQTGYSSTAQLANHQGTQLPGSGSLPMHEPKLPRGLAYGASTWGM